MIKALLISMMITTAVAPQVKTYYTPYGGQVTVLDTDSTTHDDDRIITMTEGAEIYISMEQGNGFYTLYSMEADGIHEIWFQGCGTIAWDDDFAADWQVWDYPTK